LCLKIQKLCGRSFQQYMEGEMLYRIRGYIVYDIEIEVSVGGGELPEDAVKAAKELYHMCPREFETKSNMEFEKWEVFDDRGVALDWGEI